ncbi:MAG: hypothetical protein PSN34_06265 [Urechidicola sp.]|nr:hypothetical protein [Urechidicola sp.]
MSAFEQAVEQIIKKNEKMIITSGVVSKVTDTTIDVTRDEMPDLIDVRFTSILTSVQNEFKIVPKEGSTVLCGIIENDKSEAYLLGVSEVEKVSLKIDDLVWECDTKGHQIDNKGESLKVVLSDLIDEINKIVVIYGNDVDHVKLIEIQTRMKLILK